MFEKEKADGERVESAVSADVKKVMAAIEAWYAEHFRRAALAGRAPISADDKSELTKAITAAIQSEH
jgi:hypothetical protein